VAAIRQGSGCGKVVESVRWCPHTAAATVRTLLLGVGCRVEGGSDMEGSSCSK
jgi:hypothetical protein